MRLAFEAYDRRNTFRVVERSTYGRCHARWLRSHLLVLPGLLHVARCPTQWFRPQYVIANLVGSMRSSVRSTIRSRARRRGHVPPRGRSLPNLCTGVRVGMAKLQRLCASVAVSYCVPGVRPATSGRVSKECKATPPQPVVVEDEWISK